MIKKNLEQVCWHWEAPHFGLAIQHYPQLDSTWHLSLDTDVRYSSEKGESRESFLQRMSILMLDLAGELQQMYTAIREDLEEGKEDAPKPE